MRSSSRNSATSDLSLSLSPLSPTCVTGLLAHQPRTYAIPKWAMPRAQRNADFACSGQLDGSGMVGESGSIQTVIAQAEPGSKRPTGRQEFLVNCGAPGSSVAESLRVLASSGPARTLDQHTLFGGLCTRQEPIVAIRPRRIGGWQFYSSGRLQAQSGPSSVRLTSSSRLPTTVICAGSAGPRLLASSSVK
jgi:hypothetical protein